MLIISNTDVAYTSTWQQHFIVWKKIFLNGYSFIVRRRSYPDKHFLVWSSKSDSKLVWIMFRVNNKDIRRKSTSSVSLVDFEQVNVCLDVIESLLDDF